uniref:YkwB n=1 Tax=Corynebacterium jeikeium TaxID=38289 RepID=Q83ZU2_CORJE|nr:YkwB [Corynebacterium jeikeium]
MTTSSHAADAAVTLIIVSCAPVRSTAYCLTPWRRGRRLTQSFPGRSDCSDRRSAAASLVSRCCGSSIADMLRITTAPRSAALADRPGA